MRANPVKNGLWELLSIIIRLPGIFQKLLKRHFTIHGWFGKGLHLLNAKKLRKLFLTSRIKKQRITFYPEVLIAYSPATHKPKKKILIVGPLPPTVGGITTFITGILESNLTQKYKFIQFNTSRPPLKGRIPSIQDYRILSYANPLYTLKAILTTLYHLLFFPITLLMVRPHLVHIHTPSYWIFWENSFYVLASKIFRIKAILHIHGGAFDKFYNDQNFLIKNLVRIVMGIPEKIIALSSYWQNFLRQTIGIKDNVVIINNGVVASRYVPPYTHKNENKNEVRVLFIGGTDAKRKGIYTLTKAILLVIQKVSNITFVFIGKSELENVEMLSKDLKIEEFVKILGQVSEEEKIFHFHSSDIFVLPTYSEGLPISLLEAMAAGLPIISTPVGGIPEVIDEGKNGFLIQPGDYKALAEKIVILAKDKKARQEMGKNNLHKIMDQYDQSIIIRKLSNVYSQLLRNIRARM